MSEHYHAIVWVDHRDAKIFYFDATDVERVVVHSNATGHHLQHKANTTGSGHKGVDKEFFNRVVTALTHTAYWPDQGIAADTDLLQNFEIIMDL